jgi:hypothetical protein
MYVPFGRGWDEPAAGANAGRPDCNSLRYFTLTVRATLIWTDLAPPRASTTCTV